MERLRIVWDIHYKCNYRCPYCWFDGDERRLTAATPRPAAEWLSRWEEFYERYGSAHIEITGGEPFVFPDFVPLVSGISRHHTVRITTNLSVNISACLAEFDPARVQIISSFHPTFADAEAFVQKAVLLKERGFGNTVIFVAYPPQMRLMDHYRGIFQARGIVFSVTPFCGNYKDKSYPQAYTAEERRALGECLGSDEERLRYTLNSESPRGRLCRAGQRSALLYGDGLIARCGQLKEKPFGNFFAPDFSMLKDPAPCEADFCPCDDHNYLV